MAENYDLRQLFFSSLSFIFLMIFVSSVNNTNDVVFDKVSRIMKHQNPLVTEELTLQEARIINYTTPFLAIITSLFAGLYWLMLIVIGIGLVMLYDLRPFRFKDRHAGILFPPLATALPFAFGYINSTSGFTFPISTLLVMLFWFLNGLTSFRNIPDVEQDIEMQVRNFTSTFGIEATRYLELIVSMTMLTLFVTSLLLGFWSLIGLPFIVITTLFKLRILTKPSEVLKDALTLKKYAPLMLVNSVAITLGVVGKVVWWVFSI
jgi:4-hydroxybenzoate polyprenyltransferase